MVQMVEAVQLQEVLQREKLQVNLAGRSAVRVGKQESFLVLLSDRGCPKGAEKEVRSARRGLPRFSTHIEQIFDGSVRVVVAGAQGTHDLISREAHFDHVVYSTL
jgi:hypothetical protein